MTEKNRTARRHSRQQKNKLETQAFGVMILFIKHETPRVVLRLLVHIIVHNLIIRYDNLKEKYKHVCGADIYTHVQKKRYQQNLNA